MNRKDKIEMLLNAQEAGFEDYKVATRNFYQKDTEYREAKATSFLKHNVIPEGGKKPTDTAINMLVDQECTPQRSAERTAKAEYEIACMYMRMISNALSAEQSLLKFEGEIIK